MYCFYDYDAFWDFRYTDLIKIPTWLTNSILLHLNVLSLWIEGNFVGIWKILHTILHFLSSRWITNIFNLLTYRCSLLKDRASTVSTETLQTLLHPVNAFLWSHSCMTKGSGHKSLMEPWQWIGYSGIMLRSLHFLSLKMSSTPLNVLLTM